MKVLKLIIKINEIRRLKNEITDKETTVKALVILAEYAETVIKDKIEMAVKELKRMNYYNKIQKVRLKKRIDDDLIKVVCGLKSNENNKNPDACQSASGDG